MADDANSMQMQLGLVGGTGSFNPLGIATPPPPAPPQVKHPGDVSRDVVQQTQTQMATTLQTTSAMRLGGMGGVAFGGGGGSGPGIGALGAFAQQYQQNMAGIQSQHVAPFSAQMMGMMGGMGGGFMPGMMPHPAMMTAPGMGIYRPFMQQPGPTVSPFPQMPLLPTPFTPMPPPPQFQTPMELANNMAIQAGQRRTAAMFATPGVAARAGADVGIGYMGAGVGAALGARFGPMGAAIGGTLGLAAGVFGSEHFGLGATAQHITDRLNPFRTMAIRGQQMMAASQDFVTGGADLNMMTGRGLSHRGATHLGRLLEDTAYSSTFQRQTGGAFSAQDLTKITRVSGQQGLLNDAQSVDQIHDRVKGIAKSLVGFMKIANEPNVVEALKAMGKMRQMGMSIGETMDMAMDARMYSRMAGTTVRGLMDTAGAQGAMLFQQQGLSAGLGMRMGMGAHGMASAAVAGGAFTPQRLAMLGGVQGVAQHEMESSAAFLKMPMMAAAMSRIGRGGEFIMDGRAVKSLSRGGLDINQMATMGANNMLEAVQKQGIGALGMFQVQGSEVQDNLGRLLGPQGLQMAKMQQVMQTMKMMGLDKNPGGFATAGLSMGMSNDQVKAMMSQANSPGYFQGIQRQLNVQKMELRGLYGEELAREQPGFFAKQFKKLGVNEELRDLYSGFRNMGENVVNFFGLREEDSQARERGQVVLRTDRALLGNDRTLRNMQTLRDPKATAQMMAQLRQTSPSRASDISEGLAAGKRWLLGGEMDDVRQYREAQGGLAGIFGGGLLEAGYRASARLTTGGSGGLDSMGTIRAKTENLSQGAAMWAVAQSEGIDAWNTRLAETAKSSGIDQDKLRELVANTQMRLALAAREKNVNTAGSDTLFDKASADTIFNAEAGKMGLTLNAGTRTQIGILSGKTAGDLQGGTAFVPKDFVNVKSDKTFKENLLREQRGLTDRIFGNNAGMDLSQGTLENRTRVLRTLFGEQKDAKAGLLAGILEASQEKGASEDTIKRATAIMAQAQKETPEALQQAMALRAQLKDDSERVRDVGRSFLATGANLNQMYAGAEAVREGSLWTDRALVDRSGKRALFGEAADLTKSTEELLRTGSVERMSGGMADRARRFRMAALKGESTKDILAEAEQDILYQGVSGSAETAGGTSSPTDKPVMTEKEIAAQTQKALAETFPRSVETFSEASRGMLTAARLMNKLAERTTLANGNVENPFAQ